MDSRKPSQVNPVAERTVAKSDTHLTHRRSMGPNIRPANGLQLKSSYAEGWSQRTDPCEMAGNCPQLRNNGTQSAWHES
jgi:hypothetical protein